MSKRQTASSSEFLRNVKRQMNTKIYQRVLQLENEQGRASALTYLSQFFNDVARERCLAGFLGIPEGDYRKYLTDAQAQR